MKKILVLDDNQDILEVVTEVLAYERFNVHAINTAESLISTAESFRPDLILMDLRLTDGNGGELCHQVKSHRMLYNVPVILFTAYQNPNDDLLRFGCDAVITKPFDLDDLIRTINELTEVA